MNKTLATLSILSIVVVGLSGCTLELRDPGSTSSKAPADDTSTTPGGSSSSNFGSGPCDDRNLVIDEDGSQLVLTGHCASVTITASDVAVNLETADSVTVSGANITVLAEDIGTATLTGSYIAINPDSVGSIEIGGSNNTLITKNADAITISGDFNIANWDAGAQSATDTGEGNVAVGP